MSDHLTIASVTATLIHLLSDAIGASFGDAQVSASRPDTRPQEGAKGVYVFLYAVTPSAQHRNIDVPTWSPRGEPRKLPRQAVELHYLLTFFGSEEKLEAQRLYGLAVQKLLATPYITAELVQTAVAGWSQDQNVLGSGNLAARMADETRAEGAINLTQVSLSLEELSKLWSVFFQTQYRLSVPYLLSPVILDAAGEEPTAKPKPAVIKLSTGAEQAMAAKVAPTPAPSAEASAMPAPSAEESATPAPSAELAPTPVPNSDVAPTLAPSAEVAPTPAPSTTESLTSAPSAEVAPTPAPSAEVAPTPAPSTTESPTSAPSAEVAPTPAPSAEQPPTPAPSAEVAPTPAPSAEQPPTPAPSAEQPPTPAPSAEQPPTPAPRTTESDTSAPSTTEGMAFDPGTPEEDATESATPEPSASQRTVSDLSGPSITTPSHLVAEATGPAGARVTYSVTARDDVDGDVVVSCDPPSGSMFRLGETLVQCTATDAHGNTSTAEFTVTVRDTIAPTLVLPADMVVEATQRSGSIVRFDVSATDLVDGVVSPVCTPASGSVFPIATTEVTCIAEDARHNTARGTFQVTVVLPSLPVTESPTLWLRADFGVTLDSTGLVTSWADLRGNASGPQAMPGSGQKGPWFEANSSNGLPGVRFNASGQLGSTWLELKNANNSVLTVGTLLMVARHDGSNFTRQEGLISGPSGDSSFYFTGAKATSSAPGPAFTAASSCYLEYRYRNGIEINGAAITDIQSNTIYSGKDMSTTIRSNSMLYLGRDRGYSSNLWTGWIQEVIVFPMVLADDKRQKVEQYLKTRYGITG